MKTMIMLTTIFFGMALVAQNNHITFVSKTIETSSGVVNYTFKGITVLPPQVINNIYLYLSDTKGILDIEFNDFKNDKIHIITTKGMKYEDLEKAFLTISVKVKNIDNKEPVFIE
ncbi:MAG: hypothetical protein HYU68_03075 [Bacteroidetes bacterium]|nr:hypothetical protein [Bacteroidota bacterium]